jgi:hypothetical protein
MSFNEWQFFQEKRTNLTVFEKPLFHFICKGFVMRFIERSSSMLRERT